MFENYKKDDCNCRYEDEIQRCEQKCTHHATLTLHFKTENKEWDTCKCLYNNEVKRCKRDWCHQKYNEVK